ncbi:MAG: hypothetical protein EOO75_21575, partial [Myxococcales bacterium]
MTLLVTCSARGDQPSSADRIKAAAEEFDAGRRSYNAKDYETAATHFENADRDAPAPATIRNAIRARSDAKQPARAATLAVAALARYPGDKATAQLARETLAAADKRLHRAQVTCAPACSLLLDGKLAPLAEATEFVLYLDPGPHRVTAGWSGGRNREESVAAEAGKVSSLSFRAPAPVVAPAPTVTAPVAAASADAAPPPPPATGLPRPVFYTAAGVTAVLAGLATWSAIDMRSDPGRDRVRRDCAGRDESCGTYQDALSAQRRTNVLLAVGGGALLATGVIAYFTRWG